MSDEIKDEKQGAAADELACAACGSVQTVLQDERRGNVRLVFLLCPKCHTIDGKRIAV